MGRVTLTPPEELTGEERKAYEELNAEGRITNMKLYMLQEIGTYKAFMGWYDSWASVTQILDIKDATIFAHAVSTTNGCLLCSLFFISDLKDLGLDPNALVFDEKEELLVELGQSIVKNPTAVPDRLFDDLRKFFTDKEIIVLVGFAIQMQATNNFNSVLHVDVDERLLPLKGLFNPATWRDNIE